MKHKVSELTGALLDAAVAKADARTGRNPDGWPPAAKRFGSYPDHQARPIPSGEVELECHCFIDDWTCAGSTPEEAKARAIVADQFGLEVDL